MRPWEVDYATAGRLLGDFESFCTERGLPFERHLTLTPPDDTTLFCIAGMQRYKRLFRDPGHRGTLGNVQRCLRLDDLDELGDGLHWLSFDMLGLFSFREWSVERTIGFWWSWLDRIGVRPDVVTVHPSRREWGRWHERPGVEVRTDDDCSWGDGGITGFCTELFVDGLEIGNIVNPLGTCIDVGFGLDRLCLVLGEPPPTPDEALREAVVRLLDSGYMPSNKRQGYVLRRLLRLMVRRGVPLDHPVWEDERRRQERTRDRYHQLLPHHPDRSPEWWWETHGIDVSEVTRP
ncbi:MAG: hypothetical protein H6738_25070 [Alphaproteobacteria bacterium]|nr:hypothetical protein [Alphaproteobacteria bacterium]